MTLCLYVCVLCAPSLSVLRDFIVFYGESVVVAAVLARENECVCVQISSTVAANRFFHTHSSSFLQFLTSFFFYFHLIAVQTKFSSFLQCIGAKV